MNRRQRLHSIEREAHHLHEVERAGESAETPLIAIVGLLLLLASVFVVLAALSLAACYLTAFDVLPTALPN
jgi:hypothetical protein